MIHTFPLRRRTQISRRGLEELAAAAAGGVVGGLAGLSEVVEVGFAEAAADRAEVEVDVVGEVVARRAEEVAAELAAGEAAQAVATPDFADGVSPLIATPHQQSCLLTEDGGRPKNLGNVKRFFDRSRLRGISL